MTILAHRVAIFMSISPDQCRAARALIGLSRRKLAWFADVSERTIIDFERRARSPRQGTLADLRAELEDAGVVFIDPDEEGGAGVRLKDPP
jgi:predicted transcriptional regulator